MEKFQVLRSIIVLSTIWIHEIIACNPDTEDSGVTEMKMVKLDYTWTITNFSSVLTKLTHHEIYVDSSEFSCPTAPKMKFKMTLYLSGTAEAEDLNYTSLFVTYLSGYANHLPFRAEVGILTNNGKKENVQKLETDDFSYNKMYGLVKFIKKDDVLDRNKGFLTNNDELRISIRIHSKAGWKYYGMDCLAIGRNQERRLLEDREQFHISDRYKDITIEVGGVKLPGHKIILAAASPVLAKIIDKDLKKDGSFTLEIDDTKVDVMKEVLKFIYSGKKPSDMDKMAVDLLYAADSFEIDALKEICERYLCDNLCPENAYDVFTVADRVKAKKLKHKAEKYITWNSHELISTSTFNKIIEANPSCIGNALHMQDVNF